MWRKKRKVGVGGRQWCWTQLYSVKCARVLRCQYSHKCVCVCAEPLPTLTFPPLPQSCSCPNSHSRVMATTQPRLPWLPFNGQGPSKAHHKSQGKSRQGGGGGWWGGKPHTHTLSEGAGNGACRGKTGGGHAAEEDNDGLKSGCWRGGGGGGVTRGMTTLPGSHEH